MDLMNAVSRLRELCSQHGIYTLSALSTFIAIGEKLSPGFMRKKFKQSKTCTYDWLVLFELHGLIEREDAPIGMAKKARYTEDGERLLEQLNLLLHHAEPISAKPQ
jgi:hypothetical protein